MEQAKENPKVLITEEEIKTRVHDLANQINFDYRGKEITAVCVLKGSFVFFTDMIRHLDMPLSCEFLGLSSYGNATQSSGQVKLTLDLHEPIEGKNVVIFEDIVDTGLSLQYLVQTLKSRNAASVRVCSLLFKPDSLKTADVQVDYVGFRIGEEFVVGYGIDYAERYRNLPYVGYIENKH